MMQCYLKNIKKLTKTLINQANENRKSLSFDSFIQIKKRHIDNLKLKNLDVTEDVCATETEQLIQKYTNDIIQFVINDLEFDPNVNVKYNCMCFDCSIKNTYIPCFLKEEFKYIFGGLVQDYLSSDQYQIIGYDNPKFYMKHDINDKLNQTTMIIDDKMRIDNNTHIYDKEFINEYGVKRIYAITCMPHINIYKNKFGDNKKTIVECCFTIFRVQYCDEEIDKIIECTIIENRKKDKIEMENFIKELEKVIDSVNYGI